ncbi:N-acetylmuramoyl-L-alanine amidase [Xaviernesmea oryzae]|uniref:N-acetylmuramoyl-L-alanine amidase n=2 Tax=Xaviernesmea oryzae TaxID=464029 RepID=A0A1Q9ASQ4_9HYPH|nr:N-acetylmuramoyl-L-alanine amidase [Xaviernesmea oryzae]
MIRALPLLVFLVMIAFAPLGGAVAQDKPAPSAAAPSGPLAVSGRIAGDEARARLVLEFDRKPEFALHYVREPVRIILDLPRTAFGIHPDDLKPRGLVKDIRYGAMSEGLARLVITADKPAGVAHAEVTPIEGGRFRLVVDVERVDASAFAKLVAGQDWAATIGTQKTDRVQPLDAVGANKSSGPFVIAVDAGHGGIDTGAIGVDSKVLEKNVTLGFAQALAKRLNDLPGVQAVLTREADEFLSLSERVQIARQKGASLFVSLHADTVKQADIRGATVYTISDKASDHLAASLAERENLSDAVAGLTLTDEPAEVADILIDLTRRETQAFSINLARSIVSSFEGQIRLINNPHRFAGFRVLQAPDVPSILLELGFMSNKEDEALLLDTAWRDKVADRIADAVGRYRAVVAANGG